MKIDNMRLEHQEKLFKMAEKEEGKADGQESGKSVQTAEAAADAPPKDFGFIAVSVGEGINEGQGHWYVRAPSRHRRLPHIQWNRRWTPDKP